jgi:hypothetical protein
MAAFSAAENHSFRAARSEAECSFGRRSRARRAANACDEWPAMLIEPGQPNTPSMRLHGPLARGCALELFARTLLELPNSLRIGRTVDERIGIGHRLAGKTGARGARSRLRPWR